MRGISLLIVGTVPPPTGGVTVHVSRLLDNLRELRLPHEFADLRKDRPQAILVKLFRARVVHLQVSSPLFRFLITAFLKILGKNVLFTFHGNVGRYGKFKNFIDSLSFAMAGVPIVLNTASLEKALRWNKSARMISSFIPPVATAALPPQLQEQILALKNTWGVIYATNASYLQYDKNRREVYQLIPLLEIFRATGDKALIISDPSGMYTRYFRENGITIPPNILIIRGEHSFFEVLKQAQVFLRITTTDGDSLSVKEALYLKKVVIASNVVERPPGTTLSTLDPADIKEAIANTPVNTRSLNEPVDNGIHCLTELYHSLTL